MTHYAEIDPVTKIVLRVIVAEQDFIDSGKVGNPDNWIQTSYNTIHGVHRQGKTPLRKNFAGTGYTFDNVLNAFIPPKPYPSYEYNTAKGIYENPIPMPKDGKIHSWNEVNKSWEE